MSGQFIPKFCFTLSARNAAPVAKIDWTKVKFVKASEPVPGTTLHDPVIRLVSGGEPISARLIGTSSDLGGHA